ncbi:MAG TPA: anhydro-N-acetylmuramic acid kinase [Candidatus Acidoferrum sp.]|nr:anhydro-N-acetylmuramic acid kinase [Candidatus Acidoferrum sp.]
MPSHTKLVLGMMSGTSADGIDAALVEISGAPPNLKVNLLNHIHQSFPPQVRKEILRVAEQNPLTPREFSQLHARLGHAYAQAALAACKKFRISPKNIDLIGNHGQTIFHQGRPTNFLGKPTASTLQVGDGSIIANLTAITTVSDFRPADMALGGQGAPLVPFADYTLYRHPKLGRISLNIGGIANITVIPANAKPSDVFAFDTGPGNMLIDALVQHFTHARRRYDKNAVLARRGHLNRTLLAQLMRDPYFKLKPPKSTGREYFGVSYVKRLLSHARRYKLKPHDLVHTATVFTAASIAESIHRFVLPSHKIHQLIVSGGGARNPLLLSQLAALLGPSRFVISSEASNLLSGHVSVASRRSSTIDVLPSTEFHIPINAKEALAFAILAYETFHQRPSNIPSATGARGPAMLGKISYAPSR